MGSNARPVIHSGEFTVISTEYVLIASSTYVVPDICRDTGGRKPFRVGLLSEKTTFRLM